MLGIGIVVGLLGYGLVYWGDQLWGGCAQNTFLDIMWPGGQRFQPCAKTTGSAPGKPGGNKNPGSPPGGTVPGNGSTGTNPYGTSRWGPSGA